MANPIKLIPGISLSEISTNFPKCISMHKEAMDFISKHRLWKGILDYGWLSKAMTFFAIFIGLCNLKLFVDFFNIFKSPGVETVNQLGMGISNVFIGGYDFIFHGGFKYILLILLEVLVFHFCRRALEIKTGKDIDNTFKAFLKAEKRIIKLAIRNYFIEIILTFVITLFLSMLGLEFLKAPLVLIVHCYLLGFLFLDNYFEIFSLTIKESAKLTQRYAGVALAIGLVSYLLFLIPIGGAIVAPILGGVVATLMMHSLHPLPTPEIATS